MSTDNEKQVTAAEPTDISAVNAVSPADSSEQAPSKTAQESITADESDKNNKPAKKKKEKLGFARVVMVLSVLGIIAIGAACFLSRGIADIFQYRAEFWVMVVLAIAMAVTVWLISKRSKYTRPFIIIFCSVSILSSIIPELVAGTFSLGETILGIIPDLVLIAYFAFSPRMKRIMIQPFKRSEVEEHIKQEQEFFRPKTWAFWRNVVILFCIFSIIGHWMEYCVCWLIRLQIVPGIYDPNSGIWHDLMTPFMVYGAAVVLIALFLSPLKVWLQKKFNGQIIVPLILSFLINLLVVSAIELGMGLVLNQPVNGQYPLWNYSNMPFNFMGQICLLYSSFFAVMATLVTWVVYPLLERQFARIDKQSPDIMTGIFIASIILFAILVLLYIVPSPLSNPEVFQTVGLINAAGAL